MGLKDLQDKKIKYKVPAGTQPGTVFRLKGEGVKSLRTNKKGDLYVRVFIEVPTKLSKDQADYLGVAVEGPYKPDHYRY